MSNGEVWRKKVRDYKVQLLLEYETQLTDLQRMKYERLYPGPAQDASEKSIADRLDIIERNVSRMLEREARREG